MHLWHSNKLLTIYQPNARAVPWNTKPEVLKYGPSLRGPCLKNEGLAFHGKARAVQLINSLLYGRNENIPSIHPDFPENPFYKFRRKKFSENFENFGQR